MKKVFTVLVVLFVAMSSSFAGSKYQLQTDKIDQLFEQSTEVSTSNFMLSAVASPEAPSAPMPTPGKMVGGNGDVNPVVAFVLSFFLGGLGIHRIYMGTSIGTVIGYILTLGGCGIVSLIDWIVLLIGLIDDDVSDYVNNPKFFMWAG